MLSKILNKKNLVVIGLNSGTSADGLDLAAIKINLSSKPGQIKFLKGHKIKYPASIYEKVNEVIGKGLESVEELIWLDRNLGHYYGRQARLFCEVLRSHKIRPDLIASHGQTVCHLPGQIKIGRQKATGSLQLGHPESIADQTGLITVSDFRQADIAAGGEGAPITSRAMWELFSTKRRTMLLVNIGGIANYFLIPKNSPPDKMLASDCGPGNSLLDIIATRLFKKKYDRCGRLASKGKISSRLLTILLADEYLIGNLGPSTGRERFGEEFTDDILHYSSRLKLSGYDILATTTELTAITIADSIYHYIDKYGISSIYLFGGGSKNNFLVNRIEANLPDVNIFSVDRLGLNPDYLEAICYAVTGAMTIHSISAGLPHITGAAVCTIAGRIIQPPLDGYR